METLNFLMTTSFYPPFHVGGDAVFVKYLAEELVKQGHEVHVMVSIDAYLLKKRRRLKEYTKDSGVIVHNLKSPCGIISPLSAYVLGSSHWYGERFSELLRKLKPEVVHHHNISLLGHPFLRKRGTYISIHTTHDFWLICPSYDLTKKNGRICARKGCFLCTLSRRRLPKFWRYSKSFKNEVYDPNIIISPSEFFKRILEEAIQRRIIHIPNFVPYPPESGPCADLSGFFLYAGRIDRGQGIPTLLNIFGNAEVDSKLVLVGTGNLSGYLTEFVKREGLQDKIVYLGWVRDEELHRLYKCALATINPSELPANFPLVALESLSNGTPVIAPNMGGLPEIVEKVDANLIYSSVSELKQILLEFERSKYPSEKIKSVYEKYYSPQAHLKSYFRAIKTYNATPY